MAYLQLHGIEKSFGDLRVIKGVDLQIQKGEFIVFVGPSGCGKSTLLRLIAGLEQTDGGSVVLDGRDITEAASSARDLAMVFQSYALYPHMSVFENMSFALKLAQVPQAQIREKVERAAAILNLGDYLHRRPKELSGGQRKRVNVALELLTRPPLLFLDEPTSGLDPGLDQQLMMMLKELVEGGRTVVVVTHSMDNLSLCDRVLVLATGGHVAYWGPPKEAFSYFQVTDWPASLDH